MSSKNKKGFTLVELLVVMILLAILALLAYPKILNAYRQSQKNLFLTESKNIYGLCTDEYAASLMKPNGKKKTNINFDDDTALKTVDDSFKYCVKLDDTGHVTDIKVATDTYYIEGATDFNNSTLNNIKYGDFQKFDCKYELKEEDFKEEPTIETIKSSGKYKNAVKYLLIAFGISVVLSLIVGRKVRR